MGLTPRISISADAIKYCEELLLKLLDNLCSCEPKTVNDLENFVVRTFPAQIKTWVVADAQEAVNRAHLTGKKSRGGNDKPYAPVQKVQTLLKVFFGGFSSCLGLIRCPRLPTPKEKLDVL